MTQTAGIPAREPVSRFSREMACLGLELQLETLPFRIALLYEGISDSLIHRLKSEESHRRRTALDTDHPVGQVCRSAPSGARHPLIGAWLFPHTSRPPALGCTYVYGVCTGSIRCVYGFGTVPTDLRRTPPHDAWTKNTGNSVRCYPRTRASHSAAKTFSAFPAIDDSLIPCPKTKELHCHRVALGAAVSPRAEHAGIRDQEPHSSDQCPAACTASRAHARWGVRMCTEKITDLRRSPSTLERLQRMTIDTGNGKPGALPVEGKGEPLRSETFQCFPDSRRVFARSPRRVGNDCHMPPAALTWNRITCRPAQSGGTNPFVTASSHAVLQARRPAGAGRRQFEEASAGDVESTQARGNPFVWTKRAGDIAVSARHIGVRTCGAGHQWIQNSP